MKLAEDSLTDWIQLGCTVLGGIYALYLLNQSKNDKRNLYVADILKRLYDDKEIRIILYSVDSGLNLNEIKFGGQLEQQADKTIQYLNYVGYLIKIKNLKKKDIKPFTYEINRILNNPIVQKYIDWLKTIGVVLDYLTYLKR